MTGQASTVLFKGDGGCICWKGGGGGQEVGLFAIHQDEQVMSYINHLRNYSTTSSAFKKHPLLLIVVLGGTTISDTAPILLNCPHEGTDNDANNTSCRSNKGAACMHREKHH